MPFPPIHTDLDDGAFVERRPTERRIFSSRGQLISPPTEPVRLERVVGPSLCVESGQLVVGDAMDGIQTGDVLSRSVPCGEFASETTEHDCPLFGRVVAMFVLRFTEDQPSRWHPVRVGDYRWWRRLLPGGTGYLQFGVDFGMAGIADASVPRALRRMMHMGDSVLERVSQQFEKGGRTVLRPEVPELPKDQLLVCASGGGDGVYTGHWGLNRTGQLACLMLDFRAIAFPGSMEFAAR